MLDQFLGTQAPVLYEELEWVQDLDTIIGQRVNDHLSVADTTKYTYEWYLQGYSPEQAFEQWVALHYAEVMARHVGEEEDDGNCFTQHAGVEGS